MKTHAGDLCVALAALSAALLSVNSLRGQQMIFPRGTWQTATPESVLVDSQKLQAAIQYLDQTADSIEEMLIVRNGRVIWQGNNIDHAIHAHSVTKTFTSTVMGLLIDDGRIELDTLAQDLVPALAQDYQEVTPRHFATNTSGYLAADDASNFWSLEPSVDPFDPGAPLFSPPGSQYAYPRSAWDMLAHVLTKAAAEKLEDVFVRRIADPLAFDFGGFQWGEYLPDGEVAVNGGDGHEGKGVVVSANNAARLGHLFLNHGNWNDEQLISSDWVDAAASVQVPVSIPLHPKSWTGSGPGVYGFGWWVYPQWYQAVGYKNNFIAVSPDAGFVVARMGAETTYVPFDGFESQLLAAIIPAIWDEQGDGRWDEFDTATGKPRWKTGSGMIPDIYPTGKAIVRSNTVTVATDVPIDTLDIESGIVSVAADGVLRSTAQITVREGAGLHLEGRGNANVMYVYGLLDSTANGQLEASELRLYGQGQMAFHGSTKIYRCVLQNGQIALHGATEIDRFGILTGEVHLFPEGRLLNVNYLSQLGGRLIVEGEFAVGDFRVLGGLLELHDHQLPYHVTTRSELSDHAELRFVISDEYRNSPIELAEGISPSFAGDLVLDFAALLNPKQIEGQTLNLFDWSDGIQPSGEFNRILAPDWIQLDVSQLYSKGDIVVATVVPEPGIVAFLLTGAVSVVLWFRRQREAA
jgi:CubicO group peptidase (beta-lactamase class C family)